MAALVRDASLWRQHTEDEKNMQKELLNAEQAQMMQSQKEEGHRMRYTLV